MVEKRKLIVRNYQKRIIRLYKKDTLPTDEQLITVLGGIIDELSDDINKETAPYIAFRIAILQNFITFIIDNKFDDIIMPEQERLRKVYFEIEKEFGLP